MIRTLIDAATRRGRTLEVPSPDRMCGMYGVLMERLFDVLPHEHTRMEVQQMLYTAQVLCIARHGRPLFANQFTATSKGPVIMSLWKLQGSAEGLMNLMHPIHREAVDDESRATVIEVADRLARLDAKQIGRFANAATTAQAQVFRKWVDRSIKKMERNTASFVGTESITLKDLEEEVRRRYPGINALERAERGETAPSTMADAA